MSTPASIARHPIHPILVVVPLGLFVGALVFDVLAWATGDPMWRTVAFWDIAAGIIGSLLAAVPGFVDYRVLRGMPARLATAHMTLNLTAVALFIVNWLLRAGAGGGLVGEDSVVPLLLTIVAVAILGVAGWLGGQLVYVHRIGVVPERGLRPVDEETRRRIA